MEAIVGGSRLPFDLRIYIMSTLVNMMMTLGTIFASAVSSLPGYIILLNILYLCACTVFYLLSRFWQKTFSKSYLAITQAFLSVIWFANGGLKGSIPYFFFVLLFVGLIVCKTRPLATTLLVVGNFLLLIMIVSSHKEWVVPYPNEASHFLDIATSVPIVLILLAYWTSILKAQYDKERFIDPLTGLNNRRHALNLLKQILHKERKMPDLSIAFFDVDHFKKLNDAYGHPTGDRVLKRIGEVLRDLLRDSDIVGRYGGEEFLIGLPHATKRDALKIIDRIRNRIHELRFLSGVDSIGTSISVGLVSLKEDESQIGMRLGLADLPAQLFTTGSSTHNRTQLEDLKDQLINEMIRLADERMYRAKMSECGECGCLLNFPSGGQSEICPECGGSAWVLGRNRIVAM